MSQAEIGRAAPGSELSRNADASRSTKRSICRNLSPMRSRTLPVESVTPSVVRYRAAGSTQRSLLRSWLKSAGGRVVGVVRRRGLRSSSSCVSSVSVKRAPLRKSRSRDARTSANASGKVKFLVSSRVLNRLTRLHRFSPRISTGRAMSLRIAASRFAGCPSVSFTNEPFSKLAWSRCRNSCVGFCTIGVSHPAREEGSRKVFVREPTDRLRSAMPVHFPVMSLLSGGLRLLGFRWPLGRRIFRYS